mmetsp:Transcript_9404/g.17860  ORF Transcript_9404/g.17860 Transcript_9404/m.17860 type:complete len:113 (-) Transcript_9404:459-797(-)
MRREQSLQKQVSGGQLSLRPHNAQSVWHTFRGKGGGVDDLLVAETLDPRAVLVAAVPESEACPMDALHCHLSASPVEAAPLRGIFLTSSDQELRERLGEELLAARLRPSFAC